MKYCKWGNRNEEKKSKYNQWKLKKNVMVHRWKSKQEK